MTISRTLDREYAASIRSAAEWAVVRLLDDWLVSSDTSVGFGSTFPDDFTLLNWFPPYSWDLTISVAHSTHSTHEVIYRFVCKWFPNSPICWFNIFRNDRLMLWLEALSAYRGKVRLGVLLRGDPITGSYYERANIEESIVTVADLEMFVKQVDTLRSRRPILADIDSMTFETLRKVPQPWGEAFRGSSRRIPRTGLDDGHFSARVSREVIR